MELVLVILFLFIRLVAPALCFGEFNEYVYYHNICLNIPHSLTHFLDFQLNSIEHFFTKNV